MPSCEDLFGYLGLIFCVQVSFVSGYGTGPPLGTCISQFPKHSGKPAQTTEPPFTITVTEKEYKPGQDIHISVTGKNGLTFKGAMITARRSKGDTEELLGRFTSFPADKMKTLNCVDGHENVVIHQNNKTVNQVNVTWRAPDVNNGNITFYISVVQAFDTFWSNIPYVLPSKVNIPVVPVPEVNGGAAINIDFDQCGESRGCFFYPKFCSGDNCNVFASFKTSGENRTLFQMFAKAEGYVSIGFSDDQKMGMDHTITCTINEDHYTIQNGYNPARGNYRQYKKNELQDVKVAMKDGKLYCEFTRPNIMSVANVNNPTERLTFNIRNEYYVMMAWGTTSKGYPAINRHIELPVVTSSLVNFQANKIYGGSSLPQLTKLHALLMIVAWILFTGLATVIARHFKSSFGEKLVFGAKIWFQAHRAAAVMTFVLTAVSFVIIFVKVDGLTQVATTHAYVGIALMCVTILQVIAGLLRCDPKSDYRPIFNWGHWFMGKSAHILAAAAIFLAFNINLISEEQRKFGVIIASIWVACQILWEIFYEIRSRRRGSSEGKEPLTVQKADIVLLAIYFLNMFIVLIVSILAVYLF